MPIHLLPDPNPEMRIPRRAFLASLAAAGAGLSIGCSRRAGSNGNAGGWYAWLSDIHIAADPKATVHDQFMAKNLHQVVNEILDATDPPRGVIINGDLALKDGQAADYQALIAALDPLRKAGIPIHLALGNHDDRDRFRGALGDLVKKDRAVVDKHVGVVEADGHRVLILDSLDKTNVTAGLLGASQLEWLASELDANPKTPAIVFVHHNLNATSETALTDTEAFMNVLTPRAQAKMIVFGHTHVWHPGTLGGLHAVNIPAVGYHFQTDQPIGWCIFRPRPEGGEVELRCIGGETRQDRRRVSLRWRTV